ncbi:hypothetical protein [Algihabitans albus]|uniref:hypothetical protein n=1 Tax=Algihabitans albus TaxID=2164067 RepID=UPI0013C2CBED|nr:hypothetical protein [Algihabitans albus]
MNGIILKGRAAIFPIVASILALVLALSATGSDAGPISGALDIRKSDILSFVEIIRNSVIFDHSIYVPVANKISSVVPFQILLNEISVGDRSSEYIFIILYSLQTFILTFSILALSYVATGSKSASILFLCVILTSQISLFFDIRVISSSLSISLVFWALAALLSGRVVLAGAISGVITCIHPTFGLFAMAALGFSLILSAPPTTKAGRSAIISCVVAYFIASAPFFLLYALHSDRNTFSLPDTETWWGLLRQLNNLAFPLSRGIPHVAGHMLTFLLAALLIVAVDWKSLKNRLIASMLLFCFSAYLIQMFFTSVIQSSLIAQMALNHRANSIGLHLSYLAIIVAMLNISNNRFVLSWFFLGLTMVFFKSTLFEESDPHSLFLVLPRDDYVRADTLLPVVAALALVVMERTVTWRWGLLARFMMALAVAALAMSCAWVFQTPAYHGYALVMGVWVLAELLYRLEGLAASALAKVKSVVMARGALLRSATLPSSILVTVLALFATAEVATRLPVKEPTERWAKLITDGKRVPWIKRFLDEHTSPEDRVVLKPLRAEGLWLSPSPWRGAYLDSYEGHFLLYMPSHLDEFLSRLQPYSYDKVITDSGEIDERTWQHVVAIRQKITDVMNIDDRAKWVLTYKRYTCGKDKIYATFTENDGPPSFYTEPVLIRIEDLDPTCLPDG